MAATLERSLSPFRTLGEKIFQAVPGAETMPNASPCKVTIVGVGSVGMACAATILTGALCAELALVDVVPDKLRGEMLDLQHGANFLPKVKIEASTDYSITKGSEICIITAGARQRPGESRLSLVGRNTAIFRSIVPQLVKHSPDTILLVVSNPVDILTYIAWRLSGLPPNRVIGSGTNLDTSRFHTLIAEMVDVNPQNVHGFIIGEHGDSSVPLWSTVQIAGIPLQHLLEQNAAGEKRSAKEVCKELHTKVVNGAYEVIALKGYTSWAIGYSVGSLVRSLLQDHHRVHAVSTLAVGMHGIKDEMYISLPCVLGRNGILSIISSPVTDEEQEQLHKSVRQLVEVSKGIEV